MKNIMIQGPIAACGLALLGAVSFASGARAGEGGIAGSAAFTVDDGAVTGVAVSAAVGKENAAAAAYNYDGSTGLQNSAWAIGTAGVLDFQAVGDVNGFNVTATEDSDRGTAQGNSFSADTVNIQLGTASGDALVDAP